MQTYRKDISQVARLIDHTLLKPTATTADIRQLCNDAVKYSFYAVCINPCYVKLAKNLLAGTQVKVCTVVGFPLGANITEMKQNEARAAVEDGASEIDMVIALGALKEGNWEYVKNDIVAVREALETDIILKVIVEAASLNTEELKTAVVTAVEAGADFVKTSTGFGQGGATAEAVSLMRSWAGPDRGVKASGGIRTSAQALEMIRAGANRLGCSASVKIIEELKGTAL